VFEFFCPIWGWLGLRRRPTVFKVFYSWISDWGLRHRQVISGTVYDALEELAAEPETALPEGGWKIEYCGRQEESGDIVEYITRELPQCQAHVVDLTFINAELASETRLAPNPNNMFEMGYGVCCLGARRVIPVFNGEPVPENPVLGDVGRLPFDVRNLSVIVYNGQAERNKLKRELKIKLAPLVREYRELWPRLAHGAAGGIGRVLGFFEEFLRAHGASEEFVRASLERLQPGCELSPDRAVLEMLLQALRPPAPGDRAARAAELGLGHVFLVQLRCLHADCRRLLNRQRRLEGTSLFRSVENLGQDAEHLEGLCDRVLSNAPQLLGDSLVLGEMNAFLEVLKTTRGEVERHLPAGAG
jgi:hypothetical protein